MQRELKIDLLEYDFRAFLGDKSVPPEGISVRGPIATSLNSIDAPDVAAFLVINVATGIAVNLFSSWLYDYLKKRGAERIRINGREPKNKEDFERIIRNEIEIGKND